MKSTHNLLLSLLAGAAAASSAAEARPDCRAFEATVTGEPDLARWDRMLSLAGCLRAAEPRPAVTDPEQVRGVVTGLRSSLQRPIGIYREALRRGPWEIRMLAAYQLGQTYVDLSVRAREAVGSPSLRGELEPLLVPYQVAAIDAFAQVQTIALEVPAGTAADAVVRGVVAASGVALESIKVE